MSAKPVRGQSIEAVLLMQDAKMAERLGSYIMSEYGRSILSVSKVKQQK